MQWKHRAAHGSIFRPTDRRWVHRERKRFTWNLHGTNEMPGPV